MKTKLMMLFLRYYFVHVPKIRTIVDTMIVLEK
jgi:hypothetical protein